MSDMTPERRAAIAARCAEVLRYSRMSSRRGAGCRYCPAWDGEQAISNAEFAALNHEPTCPVTLVVALEAAEQQLAALATAAHQAIGGLADLVCVHGAAFDSNEYPDWDSHCPACAALRPLVQALDEQPAPGGGGEG